MHSLQCIEVKSSDDVHSVLQGSLDIVYIRNDLLWREPKTGAFCRFLNVDKDEYTLDSVRPTLTTPFASIRFFFPFPGPYGTKNITRDLIARVTGF